MKPTLVTCFINPDLDGFACVVAYAEFLVQTGRQAEPAIFGSPQDEVIFVMRRFNLQYPPQILIHHPKDFEQVVLVDANNLRGLDPRLAPEKVIEIINDQKVEDHHAFPNAKIQTATVSATATLVAERFLNRNIPISARAAVLLYSSIISNTLNFQAAGTTERDHAMAEWLKRKVAISSNFAWELFLAKSDLSGQNLPKKMASTFSRFTLKGLKAGMTQVETIDAETLVTERKRDILVELASIKTELGLDRIFSSVVELEGGYTLFVTEDGETQKLLSEVWQTTFNEGVAKILGLHIQHEIRVRLEKDNKPLSWVG